MYDRTPKCADEILALARQRELLDEKITYIICGKPGPTGKTWICRALKNRGFKAIELSEYLFRFADFRDDKNHMCDCGYSHADDSGVILIVLNKPLDDMWKMPYRARR